MEDHTLLGAIAKVQKTKIASTTSAGRLLECHLRHIKQYRAINN